MSPRLSGKQPTTLYAVITSRFFGPAATSWQANSCSDAYQAKPIQVQLELAANGVTRFGLPKSEIGTVILPVPPLPKQRTIADYLDHETARLDALVVEKERLP